MVVGQGASKLACADGGRSRKATDTEDDTRLVIVVGLCHGIVMSLGRLRPDVAEHVGRRVRLGAGIMVGTGVVHRAPGALERQAIGEHLGGIDEHRADLGQHHARESGP